MYNYYGQQVVRVNGEASAQMYNLPPNSSALLLDNEQPIVYLLQTDGAGYKQISKFKIEPFVEEPMPDLKNFEERLRAIEERLDESNSKPTK